MFSTAAFTSWGELQADDDEALDELGPDEGDIEVVVAKDLKGVIGVPAKKIHYLIENNFNKYNSFRNVFFYNNQQSRYWFYKVWCRASTELSH